MPTAKPTLASPDVVIVGGGIMGLSCALAAAKAGLKPCVLERSVPGAEASSAAAGILGAAAESHHPGVLFELARKSRELYPRWVKELQAVTHLDVEYRASGVLRVTFGKPELAELHAGQAWQSAREVRTLDAKALAQLEPELSQRAVGGVHYLKDARIDPPALLKALRIAAERAGVTFRTGAYVRRVHTRRGTASGIVLDDGRIIPAKYVVIAAGSWSTLVEGAELGPGRVTPARGQIVELETKAPLLQKVVFGPRCYVVPRDTGRVLVGSTLEFVGYEREVVAGAVRDLLDAAIELVPALAQARFSNAWSNFRPYTKDELPILGFAGNVKNLLLATGHYRNGILLAPVTAEIIGALLSGKPPPLEIGAFSPERAPAKNANFVGARSRQLAASESGTRRTKARAQKAKSNV